jgi:hypothetical protein
MNMLAFAVGLKLATPMKSPQAKIRGNIYTQLVTVLDEKSTIILVYCVEIALQD